MYILTIVIFAHSCLSMQGDSIFGTTCAPAEQTSVFDSQKACEDAGSHIQIPGQPRYADRGIRLTTEAVAFCRKADK